MQPLDLVRQQERFKRINKFQFEFCRGVHQLCGRATNIHPSSVELARCHSMILKRDRGFCRLRQISRNLALEMWVVHVTKMVLVHPLDHHHLPIGRTENPSPTSDFILSESRLGRPSWLKITHSCVDKIIERLGLNVSTECQNHRKK